MRPRLRHLAATLGALALFAPAHAWGKPSHARVEHTVEIRGMAFVPATLTVDAGDVVVWKNEDLVPHTATATDHSFDTKTVAPGKSSRVIVRKRGTFDYVCTFHPTMKGVLTVK